MHHSIVKRERPTTVGATNDDLSGIIDLCSPTMTESTAIVGKGSIFAIYPIQTTDVHRSHPLMANVPVDQLTDNELERRRSGTYPPAFHLMHQNAMIPSFLREKYTLFFGQLIERFKIDLSILDYNYTRLNTYMKLWIAEQIRILNYRLEEIKLIDEQEYPVLLEFYLQFDQHLFYMKTCLFRFARPRSMDEGLFCLTKPEARYDLSACGNCSLCFPKYDPSLRLQPVIKFNQTHCHTFVNGYQSILNCSATCQTTNIIYVLTCPCGQYDYIGETSQSLTDRLTYHREHGHRIIHEFLLGEKNSTASTVVKSSDIISKDRMLLYQHSMQRPVAMQIFLDYHHRYWRFIPMSTGEAEEHHEKSVTSPMLIDDPYDDTIRSTEESLQCIKDVPQPTTTQGYTFSNRQMMLQLKYFHQKSDFNLPNTEVDIYNASVVAVLPLTCSNMFRSLIESFFITRADTKLNKLGHMDRQTQPDDPLTTHNPWINRGHAWHQGLVRRPKPK